MNIYNSSNVLILTVNVDDSSFRTRSVMGDDTLTLYFSLATHTEIPVGSYCDFNGTRFILMRPESLKMRHTRYFEYTVTMETYAGMAKRWKFTNTVDHRLKFPLTAKPHEHLQMLVDNLNMRDSGWSIGSCVDGVEHLISYNHNYCIEALQMMADEFETEWEISGKTVSLKKVEYNRNAPLSLSYGKGNGFKPGVGRTNSSEQMPVEILYVQGGERNIDPSVYSYRELRLPKAGVISFDGTHFEDETGYDSTIARQYKVNSDGISIQRNDKPLDTHAEDSVDCSDIYPKRIGEVGQVVVIDASKHKYDIIDSETITIDGVSQSNPCPDYSQYLIAGETMTIVFQSGMLAGREFEAKYIHKDRRFQIVPSEQDGETMPNSIYLPSAANHDKFIVFNCGLPTSYINGSPSKTGAEWDMFRAAVRYLYENEDQKFTFTGELDAIWARTNWSTVGPKIIVGGYISFQDARFQSDPVLVRITAIKEFVNDPHAPEITLSNQVTAGGFTSSMNLVQNQEVYSEHLYGDGVAFTKRRFRDAQETLEMLQEAVAGFSDPINPITVQTMAMLVGDESLQFEFVDTSTTPPTTISWQPTINNAGNTFTCPAAGLRHLTLGIETIANNHSATDYKVWSLAGVTLSTTDDDQGYYLYAKVDSLNDGLTHNTGQFMLATAPYDMGPTGGYYYLLVGILGRKIDGERSWAPVYGFTEVRPGQIRTNSIISNDGLNWFDLANGHIQANSAFIRGTIRSPFQDGDASQFSAMNFDNVITTAGHTVTLVWDETQSGRKVLICGTGTIAAPPGSGGSKTYFFYEDGRRISSALTYTNELVSLVGYGTANNFLGWVVVDRSPFYGSPQTYGSGLRALMLGNVMISTSGGQTYAFLYGAVFDGSTVYIERLLPGAIAISVPTTWFKKYGIIPMVDVDSIYVVATPKKSNVVVKVNNIAESNNRVIITISTVGLDGYNIDSDFSFVLYNGDMWKNWDLIAQSSPSNNQNEGNGEGNGGEGEGAGEEERE